MIQLQFLNYLLNSGNFDVVVKNNLTEDFFSDYRNEFNYICNHVKSFGNVPDKESFVSHFPNFDFIVVNETVPYLVNELYNDYKSRNLTTIFNKMRVYLQNDKLEEAMALLKKAQETSFTNFGVNSVDIIRDRSRFDAYVERTKNFDKFYISTGFKELDSIIGGWDREEELATIVARTNYGKSWILLKSALASAMQGLRVGIYSGEMSEKKVGYRLDTLLGHLNNGQLIHGNKAILNEYQHYMDTLPDRIPGSIRVLTPNMINGVADVNALRVFIEQDNLDILFIDQLSLLEDARKGKTPVEKASNISKDLKILQVLKRIPIISVSQQNRTKAEDGVDTTQIAQSDRIGQDSTCIIFIEKKDDIMKLTLVKSRDSENGKSLSYQVDLGKGLFNYIPSENDANAGQTEVDYSTRYEVTENGKDAEW